MGSTSSSYASSSTSRFQAPFSQSINKAVALVPKVTSAPSIVGALFIIQDVLRHPRHRRSVYHRIMLMMSTMDLLWACKTFCSTWPYPVEYSRFVYGARGNNTSCRASAFVAQASSLTSVLYSGSLTLFFLLVVRFGWKEEQFKRRRIECLLHTVPLVCGWGSAIAGMFLDLYNPWTCWIQEYPPGCTQSFMLQEGQQSNCIRGDNAGIYRWAFLWAPLWLVWFFMAVAMFLMYWHIAKLEERLERYDFPRSCIMSRNGSSIAVVEDTNGLDRGHERKTKSRQFANQASLYIVFFFVAWVFPTVSGSIQSFTDGRVYSPIMVLAVTLAPLLGFFNFFIYIRPRYIRYRKDHQGEGKSFRERIKMCIHCWFTHGPSNANSSSANAREEQTPAVLEQDERPQTNDTDEVHHCDDQEESTSPIREIH